MTCCSSTPAAKENFLKGKRQNFLREKDIAQIVSTYQNREEIERYSRRVSVEEIAERNDYNLNLSRYISAAKPEPEIKLDEVHTKLSDIQKTIHKASKKHNAFLKELGLPPLP